MASLGAGTADGDFFIMIEDQTGFDADYPWVNRLLPVWKLHFAGDDGLTAYVHTETSSLAAVNNTTKNRLQTVFRALHTWEWVPQGMDWLRVVVIGLMVGSLLALAANIGVEMPEAGVGGLGMGALGPISPSMTTESL